MPFLVLSQLGNLTTPYGPPSTSRNEKITPRTLLDDIYFHQAEFTYQKLVAKDSNLSYSSAFQSENDKPLTSQPAH
jgi:hypothetical protein